MMFGAKKLLWSAEGITSRCKFCGGKGEPLPVLNLGGGRPDVRYFYAVGCQRCDTHTLHGQTPAEAVENWNMQKYSDETYMLMEHHEMTDEGAENLAKAILSELAEDFIRARLMSQIAGGEKSTWARTARETKKCIYEWCSETGLNAQGVLRGLEKRITECHEKCVKAWQKAIKEYLNKEKGGRNGREEDAFHEDRGE